MEHVMVPGSNLRQRARELATQGKSYDAPA